jgi:hypothetical protein
MERTPVPGVYADKRDAGDGADKQPPHVLGAWIQRTLVDRAQPREQRLRELQQAFAGICADSHSAPLLQAIQGMADALAETGAGLEEAARTRREREIAAAYDHLMACNAVVVQSARDVGTSHAKHLSQWRKLLVETGLEEQQLAGVLLRVEPWLRLMWKGLTASRPAPGDSASLHKLRVLVDRADTFGAHVKRLQQAADLALEITQVGQRVMAKREALLARIDVNLAQARSQWERRFGRFVSECEMATPSASAATIEAEAAEATLALQREVDDCRRLALDAEIEEQEFAQNLSALGQRLGEGQKGNPA